MSSLPPPDVRWDLSALFSSLEDPKVETTWEEVLALGKAFEATYRGNINHPDLTAVVLAGAIRELEELYNEAYKPVIFANLNFAEDSSNPAHGAFLQKQQVKLTELNVLLVFFELELQAADEALIQGLLADPVLANYVHYVQVARASSAHSLNEDQEVILEETANTGSRAWRRLFNEVTSNHVFHLRRPGSEETEDVTEQKLLTFLRDPDRELRQAAADSLSAGLIEIERVLVFIYNNLLQDKAVSDRLRKYDYPEHSRHKANELDKETVDLVVNLCKEHEGLVARYYEVKRQVLGLPELTHIDRYAPLFETEEEIAWDRAKAIVLDSFGSFSPGLRERGEEFFANDWIDAQPRPGKSGGAFCSYCTPDTHPVLLQSYENKMDDVMTLAHELGHGVHASFSREQTLFNFHGTLPLAELASTFGEMLVFERLVSDATEQDRLALYADKIEGVFATVFRQAAMFRFEQRCHNQRRAEGELTAEQFGDLWQSEIQAMFGESVKLGDQHRRWWSYVSHFIQVPFYVYAYSFGELLVLSLYQMAKAEGPSFAGRYEALLKLGGSKSPAELMAFVGVDLKSEAFWRNGFAVIESLVSEFERLWAETGKA
ncbi:MAG: M3 family oligoendopeptidase [Fimbriimonas sp.]